MKTRDESIRDLADRAADQCEALANKLDRLMKAMPVLNNLRATMVAGKIARDVVDCPFCNASGRLHVTCAIGVNNHMSARCADCGEGFIE